MIITRNLLSRLRYYIMLLFPSVDGTVKLWDLATEDAFPMADWKEHAQGAIDIRRRNNSTVAVPQ